MNILIPEDYQNAVKKLKCLSLLSEHEVHISGNSSDNPGEYEMLLASAEVLLPIRERTHITAEFLENCPKLKLISQTGKVSGHIDIAACSKRGIAIAEGVGSPVAPAELTWALIMNASRLLPQAIQAMKEGKWQVNIGKTIKGQTVGIWSYGRIGQMIARYAKSFDARVMIWGSEKSRNAATKDGFEVAANKSEFLAAVDILSLHIRLTESTRGMISLDDLSLMKQESLLVNTSRAELIQEGALLVALRNGRPGFAALDVFEKEPVLANDPLLNMPNVICTPHLGYVEWESYETYFAAAFRNILAFASGSPENIVNQYALIK